jgi:glycosyltransferase involved in cell wall biosynthesis
MTAFKAMKALLNDIPDVSLVCTGATQDYRDPEYLPRILKWIDANRMSNRIYLVGYIPKTHQIELMKRAIAVIQPTLFEGGPGGGAVYDAIGMGIPVILSDIPVNREIENDGVHFFAARDPHSLSEQMWKMIRNPPARLTPEALINKGRLRRKILGEHLLKAASLAMQ